MEFLNDFLAWAWARHHNILSWYIRPMFIIPFIYFAYKRSWKGMIVTILALLTSMFWFPAPAVVDPMVSQFLESRKRIHPRSLKRAKGILLAYCPIVLWSACSGILETLLVVGRGGHQYCRIG